MAERLLSTQERILVLPRLILPSGLFGRTDKFDQLTNKKERNLRQKLFVLSGTIEGVGLAIAAVENTKVGLYAYGLAKIASLLNAGSAYDHAWTDPHGQNNPGNPQSSE